MSPGGIFVLFVIVGLGGALLLLALVRSEAEDRQRMDRASAEQVARRDTPEDDRT